MCSASNIYASRHCIYHFRFPMRAGLNPASQRRQIKASSGTLLLGHAKYHVRLLIVAGQFLFAQSRLCSMRYDEICDHVHAHVDSVLDAFRK